MEDSQRKQGIRAHKYGRSCMEKKHERFKLLSAINLESAELDWPRFAIVAMESLFPYLPDEIGLECLLRVDLNSHHNLRCVCKSWNAALKSPNFYQERKKMKISEQRICMILEGTEGLNRVAVYDPKENSYRNLPPIPRQIHGVRHCHFVKQKLVLISDSVQRTERNCVWIYDFACSEWRQGAEAPKFWAEFASAADEEGGFIYVAGGFGESSEAVLGASVYNVEKNEWNLLPDMNISTDYLSGFFADGKFYVMGCSMSGSSRIFEVFDSETGRWKTLENRFDSVRFVRGFQRLFCFSGRSIVEYDCRQDKLNVVGTFTTKYWVPFFECAVVLGRNMFLSLRDPFKVIGFYMLVPSGERGGTFEWICIERPLGFQGYAIPAAAVMDL